MKKIGKITQEVEIIVAIHCNKCGEMCTTPTLELHEQRHGAFGNSRRDWYGLIEVGFTTGYFSDVLPDGTAYRFSLCEPCVKELMNTFKIPAEEEDYI